MRVDGYGAGVSLLRSIMDQPKAALQLVEGATSAEAGATLQAPREQSQPVELPEQAPRPTGDASDVGGLLDTYA